MTELSFPWPDQDPDIGDGRAYTANEWDNFWEAAFTQWGSATEGVFYGARNALAVTSPGANQIEVDTGVALVAGKKYSNDAVVSLAPASPAAGVTRQDSVILQADWDGSGQTSQYTVRAVIKEGTDTAYPTLTQTDNSLWEIELARYVISDTGTITELTDRRSYCHFATKVSSDMLEAHASLHEDTGADEISVAGLAGALADAQEALAHDLAGAKHNVDTLADLNAKISDATLDNSTATRDPNAHKTTHQNTGADEISVAGLSGRLADDQPADTLGGQSPATTGTANTIMQRDAAGRSQVAEPSANADIATKNYVDTLAATGLPSGIITLWSGSIANIPAGWVLCDGANGTPNLQDRFVVGAGSGYAVGDTGGAATNDLSHTHSVSDYTNTDGEHNHGAATGEDTGQGTFSAGASGETTGATTVDANLDNVTVTVTDTSHTHWVPKHTHPISLDGDHNHYTSDTSSSSLSSATENRPPYYALAFIMRT